MTYLINEIVRPDFQMEKAASNFLRVRAGFYITTTYPEGTVRNRLANKLQIIIILHWRLDLGKVSGIAYLESSMSLDVCECK